MWIAALPCLVLPVCLAAAAGSPIQFDGAPAELAISQVSDCTVRVQLTPLNGAGQPQTEPPSPALVLILAKEKYRARKLGGASGFRAGKLRVTVEPFPLTISVRRADGSLVQEVRFAEDGSNTITFRTAAPVLGLGEGGPQFDRRGHYYSLENGERAASVATYGVRVLVPFLIGTEGWALFVSEPPGEFDLRGGQGAFHRHGGAALGQADVFVTDAREPASALREFVRLTGAPVLPPKWALGYMQSHRTLSTEADMLTEAREFRRRELPCDAFIFLGTGFCPAGWNLGHDSFDFNTNVFVHDANTVVKELHVENLHVVLHVVPLEKNHPALHGKIPAAPGEILDAQDIGNYWNRHRALFAAGVDGWWPDEGDWLDVPARLERHRMYYEGPLNDRPNERPWNLQRNGYAGIARYGGWIWSGDISSSWKTLAAQIAVGLNSSLSVSPFWGTDVGGFYPGPNREYTGELYARWFEFATFCPSFRSHGRTWQLHLPWGWNTGDPGPVESKPAPDPAELHNAAVEPICQKYLDLRYQLMPYTYSLARDAHDTGLPLMRALWLEYPDDAQAVALGDEYLWGADLLIAPVVEKGARTRRLYLPPGTWFDWWSGEKLAGQRWLERPVDLETMPIYARAGSVIPLDPVRQYTAQPVSEPTTLQIYPGQDGVLALYDDDGKSLDYLQANNSSSVWIRFRWNDQARQLEIEPDPRMKKWPGGTRVYAARLVGSDSEPRRVEFNGAPLAIRF
ncbi:MAG: TIM-barrel domain-containing protein [Verrucomicrobiota bacterium]|jgi:alpha-glucosidase/alpha-D-xyloside xylohydrolase